LATLKKEPGASLAPPKSEDSVSEATPQTPLSQTFGPAGNSLLSLSLFRTEKRV